MFTRLWDRAPLTVDFLDGPGPVLTLSFASVGHDPLRPPSPEFVGTARAMGPALFLQDESRSWGHAPGFEEALATAITWVRARHPIGQVLMLGQSMGAYAALVAASLLPADRVIAFSPQAAIDPVAEPRWREWTARIPAPRFATCPLPEGPEIWLFHGLADDLASARAFGLRPGLTHVLFDGIGHSDLCPHLKSRGVLSGLVQAIAAGDRRPALRIAAAAGGISRKRRPLQP